MLTNQVAPLESVNIDSATLTGNFQAINPDGFERSAFLVIITNDSNQSIEISYDGSTLAGRVRAASELEVSAQNNAQPRANVAQFPAGTIVYARGTAGTGTINLAAYAQVVR